MKGIIIIVLLFFIVFSFADNVEVSWVGTCTGNNNFGFTWSATDGGETFKPDGANGAMVPCNEYFEVSFSFVDLNNNVINFPAIAQGALFSVQKSTDANGNVIITIPPEISMFGSGAVTTAGATSVTSNAPFQFQCTAGVPNIRISTNYMLTATNTNPQTPATNYIRTLNNVTDGGNFGTGQTVMAPNPPGSIWGVGQTMCLGVGMPATTFAFPTNGAYNPITNPNANNATGGTAGVLPITSIIAIVISLIGGVVIATAIIVLILEYRRKKGMSG